MLKTTALVLAAWYLGTGLWLLVAPLDFYGRVPGLAETGPANPHLLRDVGAAFAASGLAFGWGMLRRGLSLALAGLGFPLLHALLHLPPFSPPGPGLAVDLVGVVLPAGLGLALVTLSERMPL